ncbi:hypothetical protein [Pedobacter sp. KLB.chiD]|uniref:hypothetical protein n=1 Tax=Pedobacter sp. KLB.chiD TaxID=3387402 RepID=UPI00399AC378
MELKATIEIDMDKGEKLLVIVTNSQEDQDDLYNQLLANIKAFKDGLNSSVAHIAYITAGYWDKNNVIVWQKPFIELNINKN